jgi:hypothetical protein
MLRLRPKGGRARRGHGEGESVRRKAGFMQHDVVDLAQIAQTVDISPVAVRLRIRNAADALTKGRSASRLRYWTRREAEAIFTVIAPDRRTRRHQARSD